MTPESVPPTDSPHDLLVAVRDLSRQVRSAQRGTWFPLLVFGVITLASIPIYRYAPRSKILGTCRSGPQHTVLCSGTNPWAYAYWLVALIVAYVVIAAFYVRQSRRRGVGTPVRPYVIVGVILAVATAALTLWLAFHTPIPASIESIHISLARRFAHGLATPMTAIGLALLVLAWVERNRALLAYTVVYLAIVLAQAGQITHSRSQWFFLPHLLIPAVILLAGSAGFALFRPATDRSAR